MSTKSHKLDGVTGSVVLNTSTCATCPRHIWMHEVTMLAIAKGANGDACRAHRDKLNRWYNAGEPVWMAADSLAFLVKRAAIEARAVDETAALRKALRKGVL